MPKVCCATCVHFRAEWSGCGYTPPMSVLEALRQVSGNQYFEVDGGYVPRPGEHKCSAWSPSEEGEDA